MHNYYVKSRINFKSLDKQLTKIESNLKEFRITSIVMSALFWCFVFVSEIYGRKDVQSTVYGLVLALSAFMWSFVYVYTIRMPRNNRYSKMSEYFDFDGLDSNELDTLDEETIAMVVQDLDYFVRSQARRLRLVRMLVVFSVFITTMSVISLTYLRMMYL